MPPVEWKKAAMADLWAIVDYISDDNPQAAQDLKDDIEARAQELTKYPQMYGAGRVKGTREIVVRKNYIVVYSETPRLVSILRVLHAAQKYP